MAVSVSGFAASASDVTVTRNSIANEFIKIEANENSFFLRTASGKNLLSGSSSKGGTSKCVYAVDDQSGTIGTDKSFSIDDSTKSISHIL